MQEAVFFTNWTAEDFTHTWDGTIYTFPKGTTMMLQDYLAHHFAKHLVDRELNRQGQLTSSPLRTSLLAKCFVGQSIHVENETKLEAEVLNANAHNEPVEEIKPFCEFCDSKGVRHKKDCTANQPVETDEEFAGLKE